MPATFATPNLSVTLRLRNAAIGNSSQLNAFLFFSPEYGGIAFHRP